MGKKCDCRVNTQLIINLGVFFLHINLSYKAQNIFKSGRKLDADSIAYYSIHFETPSAACQLCAYNMLNASTYTVPLNHLFI